MTTAAALCLRRLAVALSVCGATAGAASEAFAQDAASGARDCAAILEDDTRGPFSRGRFDRVEESLRACLDRDPTHEQRIEVYSLAARMRIERGDIDGARRAVRELVRLDPTYGAPEATPVFRSLLREARGALVNSVSKQMEDGRLAPATVTVVTREQIRRRGYVDIEELLHDVSGLDISRGNGDVYSNIYPRGYRSNATDRTLFLIDGVEQNDLHSNIVYLSRQYPLSNVERVEIVYGPASTIYGSGAYGAVISVVTRSAADFAGDGAYGGSVAGAAGAFESSLVDATIGGAFGGPTRDDIQWKLTARSFRSNDLDRRTSGAQDLSPEELADGYASTLRLEGARLARYLHPTRNGIGDAEIARAVADAVQDGIRDGLLQACRIPWDPANPLPFAQVRTACAAQAISADDYAAFAQACATAGPNDDHLCNILPTGTAVARAIALDALAFLPSSDSDRSRDWYVRASLQMGDFEFGVDTWRRDEGSGPWYSPAVRPRNELSRAVPTQTNMFARYSDRLAPDLELRAFARYRRHSLDDDSSTSVFATYANRYFDLLSLVGTRRDASGNRVPDRPGFQRFGFNQTSSQFRTELTLDYAPGPRFGIVGGLDYRANSIQSDFTSSHVGGDFTEFDFAANPTPSTLRSTDVGVFAQARVQLADSLRLVGGLRVDTNRIASGQHTEVVLPRIGGGNASLPGQPFAPADNTRLVIVPTEFGTTLTPRVALIYTPGARPEAADEIIPAGQVTGDWVVKLIYSEATQDPANVQRFSRLPFDREFANPALGRERARNVELSIGWSPVEELDLRLVRYRVRYSDVIQQRIVVNPCCVPRVTGQLDSIGDFNVDGWQLDASYSWRRFDLTANLSRAKGVATGDRFVDEFGSVSPFSERRIGDLANLRVNVILNARVTDPFNVNLRANYVGPRRTGPTTTVSTSPFERTDAYTTFHAAATYRFAVGRRSFTQLQVVARNLFDTVYVDPGVNQPLFGYSARILQPGRTILGQVTVDF